MFHRCFPTFFVKKISFIQVWWWWSNSTGWFFLLVSTKMKTMGSQSEILFHEILYVQKILVGWTTFFFLVLKIGRTSQKNHPVFSNWHCLSWSEGLSVISNESMDFNDRKEFDDPRYSMIPVIRWTLIIQSLRWYLHLRWSCYNRKHRFRLESNST